MELHAAVKQIQRSSGRSSVAAAAYRSGMKLTDERTGLIHDYTKKTGVEHSRIYAPANAPTWATDREKLWNATEVKENRKNSCTARELEIAFPAEFHAMQRREAGDTVAKELMRRYGCAVDIAFHTPSPGSDDRNYHAHILFTTRSFDETTKDGWQKKKYRDLNNDPLQIDGVKTTRGKQEVLSLRQFTADEMNRIAERDALKIHVDHLSFAARGIDREPQKHLGNTANKMEQNGKESRIANENRAVQYRNAQRAKLYIVKALQAAAMTKKTHFEQAAAKKQDELANQNSQLRAKHDAEKKALEKGLSEDTTRLTIQSEMNSIQTRLKSTGVVKIVRAVFRKEATDKTSLAKLQVAMRAVDAAAEQKRFELKLAQGEELKKHQERQQQQKINERMKSNQQQSGSQSQSDSRKRGKPKAEPPPPRHALKIAQEWAEKSGQNVKRIKESVQARKIDTSKMQIPENEKPDAKPTQDNKISVEWAERQAANANKEKDQAQKPAMKPSRSRGRKPGQ